MTLRNRFLLVGLGIVIFTILTPIVVLYALGYQINWETKQITKTASLIINSEPKRADIYINSLLQRQQTNATVRFILPGDYNIELKKEGYQSWTKRLNFRSALVTWANQDREFITLFLQKPIEKLKRAISFASVSNHDKEAVVVEGNTFYLYESKNGDLNSLNNPPVLPLIESSQASTIYNYLRYSPTRLFSAEQLSNARTYANDNHAFAIIGTTGFLSKNNTITPIANNVSGAALSDEHLWYIEGNVLKHRNINIGAVENVATLSYTPINAEIIWGEGRIFLVLDGTLFALNDELSEIGRGVNYAYWDERSNLLVYANNNEAFTYNPNNFEITLIIRSTTVINQPIINTFTGYIFFLNEGKVKAIELDGRDHRNIYTIYEGPVDKFLINDEGKILTTFTDTEIKTFTIR